jgi:hypothetical protein
VDEGESMTIIEARYVGPVKVPEWGEWHPWSHPTTSYRATKDVMLLQKQFRGLYEFRMVKL